MHILLIKRKFYAPTDIFSDCYYDWRFKNVFIFKFTLILGKNAKNTPKEHMIRGSGVSGRDLHQGMAVMDLSLYIEIF